MFELRLAEHSVTGVQIIEIWEGDVLRGAIYPIETGVKIFSKFLAMSTTGRVSIHPKGRESFVSLNLRCEPYFPGQKPALCGHYYPEVLRMNDILDTASPTYRRHFNCCICGTYSVEIPEAEFDPGSSPRIRPFFTNEGWRQNERERLRREGHE